MNTQHRTSAPLQERLGNLGLLAELAGTWVGSGFNLIAVPDKEHNKVFRLIVNATREHLVFTPIGGPVPNRGSEQGDIDIFGLTYMQQISDDETNEPIHIENGMWLNIPQTSVPDDPPSIARQSIIPHGNSVLAIGQASIIPGSPTINPVSPIPTILDAIKVPDIGHYLDPYKADNFPKGFNINNPNQALTDVLDKQKAQGFTVIESVVLQVNTKHTGGGIENIPFVTKNANTTQVESIFWIEKIQRPDGSTFMQLQYTQTVDLVFALLNWPHISVATLVKR